MSALTVQGLFVALVIKEAWRQTSYLHQRCWRPQGQYHNKNKEEGKGRTIRYTHNFSNLRRQITVSPEWKQMTIDFTDIDLIKGNLSEAGAGGWSTAAHMGPHAVPFWLKNVRGMYRRKLKNIPKLWSFTSEVKSASIPVVPTNFMPHVGLYDISVLLLPLSPPETIHVTQVTPIFPLPSSILIAD